MNSVRGVKTSIVIKEVIDNVDTLIAFYIKDETTQLTNTEISNYLLQCLPRYMIPSVISEMLEIPLGENGKINRKALVAQIPIYKKGSSANTEQITHEEEKVLIIWKDVLNQEVGLDSDFFEMGGNSLQAIKLINKLSEELIREVSLGDLFENPSARKMTRWLGGYNE